jgi:hypothetical protein
LTKAVKRGSFQNLPDLIEKIMKFIEPHNEQAKAFGWTASAEDILAKVEKYRKQLKAILARRSGKLRSLQMKTAVISPVSARSRRGLAIFSHRNTSHRLTETPPH